MMFMAAGAAIGATMSIMNARSANKAAIEAYKKQVKAVITSYNYNQQQLNMQEQSTYTAAQAKLQELTINSMQNNSTVTAALNETGYEGRNKKHISRNIEGQALRQKTAVIDAHELEVTNIRSQKQALYIQTDAQLDNMREATNAQITGGSQMLMGAIGGALQGAALGSMAGAGFSALGAGLSAATSTAGTAAAGTAAQSAYTTFAQTFTEKFATEWAANSGLVNALNTTSMGFSALMPRRGYYY